MRNQNNGGRVRLVVLLALCCAVFALFLGRLAWMQFTMADHYAERVAEAGSASYTVEQPAARGAITDANGTVLAQDATVYDAALRVPAPPGTDYQTTINQIQPLLGGEDVQAQLAAFCSAVSAGELPLTQGLSPAQAAAWYQSAAVESGAVRLTARGQRIWPQGAIAPQQLGATGAVSAAQWEALRDKGVALNAQIGQSGLEAAYDDLLRGKAGKIRITAGRDGVLRDSTVLQPAQPGATLVLALDGGLQATLQTALTEQIHTLQTTRGPGQGKEANAGAAVVVDCQTGGILAAVSVPGYTPEEVQGDYTALAANPAAPLLDRTALGLYAPGSAFKPAVAIAALTAGQNEQETVFCGGRYAFYSGYQPGCLQYSHSGPVDLHTALTHSCNIYFYDVGRRLGVDAFAAMAQALGLAAPTGVETEGSGLPTADGRLTWQSDANYQNGLTLMAAIGQGNTAVTPLQLAAYAATLANGGRRPTLHYAEKAVDAAGNTVWQYTPTTAATVPGGDSVFAPVQAGMASMASTLRVLREAPVPCAAKTGSPQLAETMPGGGHYVNSVLIGFAPVDAPRIAVAVVLEKGGGGSAAAPILRAVLDYCAQEGRFCG